MRLFIIALLFAISYAQTVGSEKFVPDEIPQPPSTQKEGVLPPLTQLAEKHGMKEHKDYTKKLDARVVKLEGDDVKAGNALVHSLETAVDDAKDKLELAKESRDSSKEKFQNDKRNHVAAGIFMHAEIQEAHSSKKKYKELAETAESRAQVKVNQAQADVSAKNEVIQTKDKDIERLNSEVKGAEAKGAEVCDSRVGKMRREHDAKTEQLTKIKDDEIASSKEATRKADEATQQERETCAEEAEAAKGRCTDEVSGVKEQVKSLQDSLKEKNEAIKGATEQCNKQIATAKDQCTEEKKGVQERAKEQCDVEIQAEKDKVSAAEQNLQAEKAKLADIEQRLTKEKDDSLAKCDGEKDAIEKAARDEVTKNQKAERGTCDKQKKKLKKNHQTQSDHLNNEIGTLKGQYKNAISTMQGTQSQELKALRDQLRQAERARDDFKDKFSNIQLKYKQVEQQLKQNLEVTKNTALNLNEKSMEADVASAIGPQDMAVSSSAFIAYASLLISATFLSGAVVKLRSDSSRTKNYNTVLEA